MLGQLRNARLGPDGVYADLHYLKSHPMAKRVVEAAERMPSAFGLSHNVSDWKGGYEGGTYVVRRILEVESVDLVADPATTSGLFESHRKKKQKKGVKRMKLTEWLRHQKAPVRVAVRRLIEAEAMAPSMLVDDGTDPEAAIKSAFRAAITAILDDDTADKAGKIMKIKEILGAEEKLMASGAVTPTTVDDESMVDEGLEDAPDEEVPDFMSDDEDLEGEPEDNLEEEEDEDMEPDDDEESSKYESLRRKYDALQREVEVQRLCEAEKVTPGPAVKKALLRLDNDNDRRALLRESRRSRRHAGSTPVEEKEFAAAIIRSDDEDDNE